MMESTTPLLNEYKLDFFWKRFPQTVLGGLKPKFSFRAPVYIYIGQFSLFLLPWLIAVPFIIALQLNAVSSTLASCLYAGIMALVVMALHIVSAVLDKRTSIVTGLDGPNLLSDDDEHDFDGCFTAQTYLFILPRKKYTVNIILHALVSGLMCGLSLLYLLPSTLSTLYNSSLAVSVVILVIGWLVVCIAQYPLTTAAPPETATFRTSDVLELMALLRPFYVLLLMSVDLAARYEPVLLPANQVLHIVFLFLPLLWTLGVLPPVDAFFLWAMEQVSVHGYGGSPMATDLRLILMTLASTIVFITGLFIKSTMIVVILLACLGYILSTDLGQLGSQTLSLCGVSDYANHIRRWTLPFFVYHVAMVIITGGVAFAMQYFQSFLPTGFADYVGYAVFAVLVVEHTSVRFQSVYVSFGCLRSRLYPKSVQRNTIFRKGKRLLDVFGWIRRICIGWVGPLLMLTYLSASINTLEGTGSTVNTANGTASISNDFLPVLGTVRVLRWIWQDTSHCLLEVSVVHLRTIVYPNDPFTSSLHLTVFLLLVSFFRDRFYQLLNKLYFYTVLLITSYSNKKQRRKSSAGLIVISCLLLPLVLAVIGVSVVLSSPLLPLFTLPVMMFGFMRHQRFWPEAVGSSANTCPDSVFYRHLTPRLCQALKRVLTFGGLGSPDPGNLYLARFQDRMIWINVLERGHAFCTLSIKGLEMQETSCHTVEAARVDDMFERAFELEGGNTCCRLNPHPLNTLTPLDAVEVETYSDAKNVLTGIIDSPDNLQILNKSFIRSLVWVLLQHTCDMKAKRATSDVRLSPRIKSSASVKSPMTNNTASTELSLPGTVHTINNHLSDRDKWATDSITANSRPTTAKSRLSQRSSLGSWSDDNESLALEPISSLSKPKVNLLTGLTSRNGLAEADHKAHLPEVGSKRESVLNSDLPTADQWQDADDLIDELEGFGLPALDIHASRATKVEKRPLRTNMNNSNSVFKPVTNLAGSMQFSSPYSSRLSLPLKWREIPVEQSQLNSIVSQFPREWFSYVLTSLDLSVNGRPSSVVASEIGSDDILVGIYAQMVMACYAIVNILGLHGVDAASMGPSHVYKSYCGDIPWSPSSDWLTDDEELMQLVVKAYRYAVKLMIDQAIMGEASSNEELQEYLEDYDQNVFIGQQTDQQWQEAIMANKPVLFALGHDPVAGTYTSRVLTLSSLPVLIGRLNKESVHSQWANLNLELLYLTNDDEERYSIQAHPTILRNLTVQAADPPLGYPVYASPPISVPIL